MTIINAARWLASESLHATAERAAGNEATAVDPTLQDALDRFGLNREAGAAVASTAENICAVAIGKRGPLVGRLDNTTRYAPGQSMPTWRKDMHG